MLNITMVSTTKCTDCGKEIETDWKFCPYCKEKQKKEKCVHCKKEINAHWKFCPFCKKSLKVKSYVGTDQMGDDWIRKLLRTS